MSIAFYVFFGIIVLVFSVIMYFVVPMAIKDYKKQREEQKILELMKISHTNLDNLKDVFEALYRYYEHEYNNWR